MWTCKWCNNEVNDSSDTCPRCKITDPAHFKANFVGKKFEPEDEKPEDEKPEDEKPKDEKPEDEKPEDKKPKDEKPKDEKLEDYEPPHRNSHISVQTAAGLIIGFLLVAILFPVALTQMTNVTSAALTQMTNVTSAANATSISNGVTSVFLVLLPVLVIIGVAVALVDRD